MMPKSMSARSIPMERPHIPIALSTSALATAYETRGNQQTHTGSSSGNNNGGDYHQERGGDTGTEGVEEGDGREDVHGSRKEGACKWECLETRFDRLVRATREARKKPTEVMRVSKVLGPAKVCSHLVDSVNENDGAAGDDVALVVEMGGALHVVHGVSLLLIARRRGRAGMVEVGTISGLTKEDVGKHYALLVLAAQVTSNATVPAAFLAYVWGREGDAFLPLYVRLAAQPFVTPGLRKRASFTPASAASWSSSLLAASPFVPRSAPPSIATRGGRAKNSLSVSAAAKMHADEMSSSSSSSLMAPTSAARKGRQDAARLDLLERRKESSHKEAQAGQADHDTGLLCVPLKHAPRMRNHNSLRGNDNRDGKAVLRRNMVNPSRTGEAPPIYADDVVIQRKLSDLLTNPLSTCLSLASSPSATSVMSAPTGGPSSLSTSSMTRRTRWLATPNPTASHHHRHHHAKDGPASLGTLRPFVRDRHTRVIATFDLLNDDLLVDSHRLHHSRRPTHSNSSSPSQRSPVTSQHSDLDKQPLHGDKRREIPRFRRDSWLEPKSN